MTSSAHAALQHWTSAAGIDRVAEATARVPLKMWGFGENIAMEALLAAGPRWREATEQRLIDWARTATLAGNPLAHVVPGVPLLVTLADTEDRAVAARAAELARILREAPVGRAGARIHRPDLPGWSSEVWIDCAHLDGPFLALYADRSDDSSWYDEAAANLLGHLRLLQDEVGGLCSHGFDDAEGRSNHIHWGRGQGWALLGLVDTLRTLPGGHAARPEIVQRLEALIDALAQWEDGVGRWHNVVDRTQTSIEPSTSAFVALGLQRAGEVGLALKDDRQALVARAIAFVASRLDERGVLTGVSAATPVGTSLDQYERAVPEGAYQANPGGFAWGQGPALLSLIECGVGAVSGA